jgi:hypothetical protein
MAIVILPARPAPMETTFEQIDYGGNLVSPGGGTDQRVNRNGNRWALAVQMPVMEVQEARYWLAALTRGRRHGVQLKLLQPDMQIGSPGAPLVDGDGQAGDILNIKGMTPRYPMVIGQWFNHVQDGFNYLYQITGSGNADGEGEVAAQIEPPLRAEAMADDVLNFGSPVIEGLLVGQGQSWTLNTALHTGLSFTIRERR